VPKQIALPTYNARTNQAVQWLEVFEAHARVLADRVRAGNLLLVDAVDMAHAAATWSGLVDCCGDDAVQTVLNAAFMGVPKQRP
jgi:hypothetical protein